MGYPDQLQALLLIMAWWDREGWLKFRLLGDSRVVDEEERDEKRWGKAGWETGIWRISCPSQFTIRNMAGKNLNLVCNDLNTRSSKPNQTSCTPDFSYPLIFCRLFLSSSPSFSFLSITLPSLQNTKLSHPLLSLCVMIISWHRVQHTPSTASTQDSLSSLHSNDYKLTLNVASASSVPPYMIDRNQTSSPWEIKAKVTLSQSHSCKLTNGWIESQYPAWHPSTLSKYSSKLARLRPPSSHDHGPQVHLQTHMITAFKLTRLRPPSEYLNLLDCGLQVHFRTRPITASKCISKLAWLGPPNCSIAACKCISPNSLDHSLQVYLQTRSIMASKCFYTLTRSWSRSASRSSLDHSLEVYVQIHSNIVSNCNSKLAQSQSRSASPSSLDDSLQL